MKLSHPPTDPPAHPSIGLGWIELGWVGLDCGSSWIALVWIRLDCGVGLDWIGLDWSVLDWVGLDWCVLDCAGLD